MIDKIFIPTVNRVDKQVTYNNLSEDLKKRVTMVVQSWEADEYDYPCEYLVLPEDIHFEDYYAIAKTRQHIYSAAEGIKYAILDDDLIFYRINSKYVTGISNMEKSKRVATADDLNEMFSIFDKWLDLNDVSFCGCGNVGNPPQSRPYRNNTCVSSCFWINGKDIQEELPNLDLTSVGVFEDTYFVLQLLLKGYGNRVSSEFVYSNLSVTKKNYFSDIWDNQESENTLRDYRIIEDNTQGTFKIVYSRDGSSVQGGFRDSVKTKIHWNKAYALSKAALNLEDFFE